MIHLRLSSLCKYPTSQKENTSQLFSGQPRLFLQFVPTEAPASEKRAALSRTRLHCNFRIIIKKKKRNTVKLPEFMKANEIGIRRATGGLGGGITYASGNVSVTTSLEEWSPASAALIWPCICSRFGDTRRTEGLKTLQRLPPSSTPPPPPSPPPQTRASEQPSDGTTLVFRP